MTNAKYPDKDLKILLGIGAVLTVIIIALPIMVVGYVFDEIQRFDACQGRSPEDAGCKPSLVWELLGENLNSVMPEVGMAGLGEEGNECGGVFRLPCQPGLHCELPAGAEADSTVAGKCVKD
ncbi:hypothetical protein KKF59_01820 [Patescibacteria group bacterium]|nr:hypothetical protein [Patescibacteria group bacterium]MBU1034733.1 hypothetical protein [Patescibacteria group bacterium]MBU1629692.1 hypothetical protein [Patescibacteria group bacterium]MBU1907851.1 hypothetical protein [Patescibacteria group bacterium]